MKRWNYLEALKIIKTKDKMVKIQITEVILPYYIAVSNDYDNNLFGKTVNKTLGSCW